VNTDFSGFKRRGVDYVLAFGIISGRLKRPKYEDDDSEDGDIPETDPDTVGEKEGGDKPNDGEEEGE
jgi:hypothetical protein